jgi:AcrR family transcriptional regulator
MPRPTSQQIDAEILETAATLFARHGFKETSVQRIADAVGYSKTGLLHRYPTKEALQRAVIEHGLAEIGAIGEQVTGLVPGPERDRAVITGVARLALDCPGTVALALNGLTSGPDSEFGPALEEIGQAVFAAFGDDVECEPVRLMRVTGALGALAVASVALRDKVPAVDLDLLVDISYDALGHGRTGEI